MRHCSCSHSSCWGLRVGCGSCQGGKGVVVSKCVRVHVSVLSLAYVQVCVRDGRVRGILACFSCWAVGAPTRVAADEWAGLARIVLWWCQQHASGRVFACVTCLSRLHASLASAAPAGDWRTLPQHFVCSDRVEWPRVGQGAGSIVHCVGRRSQVVLVVGRVWWDGGQPGCVDVI